MPEYKDIERDFEEDYWHYYPYFKFKKQDEGKSQSNIQSSGSPRKSKVEELHRKVGRDVFSVIKSHLHHDRYAPIV